MLSFAFPFDDSASNHRLFYTVPALLPLSVFHPPAHELDIDEMMRRCLRGGFTAGAFVLASLFTADSAEKSRKIELLRQKYPGMDDGVRELEAEVDRQGLQLGLKL